MQKAQRFSDKCRKIVADFSQGFGNKAFFLQVQNIIQTKARSRCNLFFCKQGSGISRRVTTCH